MTPERKTPRAAKNLRRKSNGRTFDAFPDRVDVRDWPYIPTLAALPRTIVNCHRVPEILDQGTEGACTGFALAAVVNFLLHARRDNRRVSPRMFYEMARCYDEWPGENYDGSSARGAMKGWTRHGVCTRKAWPDNRTGRKQLTDAISQDALRTPCGAYYRVNQSAIRDIHAALHEVGIVYATLMVHDGWDEPGPATETVVSGKTKLALPIIRREGKSESGHAVALVGYTCNGFIVQNSWGKRWGKNGFALLPYEDFRLHATDVWVAQLGVPLAVDLWRQLGNQGADSTSGRFRLSADIPLTEIRPYVVDLGNNGELSQSGKYWTTEEDLFRLFDDTIPTATKNWKKKRVLLYLHGGINSELDAAKRIVAMRDVCKDNEIYPLHIMWETGPLETVGSIIGDMFTRDDTRSGSFVGEAKNRLVEITAAPFGRRMWDEMKENAVRASDHRKGLGGMQLLAKYANQALAPFAKTTKIDWELHVIAHSAGSILLGHALPHVVNLGIPVKSVQLFAPAIRIDDFKRLVMPHIDAGSCPPPTMYILNAEQERSKDPTMGPYGKSLLWLVSNAFEEKRGTPILGMQRHLDADVQLHKRLSLPMGPLPGLVVSECRGQFGCETVSASHGGFDNDPLTMNSALYRILGTAPKHAFTARDLQFE